MIVEIDTTFDIGNYYVQDYYVQYSWTSVLHTFEEVTGFTRVFF
jgi:hypothetical protein